MADPTFRLSPVLIDEYLHAMDARPPLDKARDAGQTVHLNQTATTRIALALLGSVVIVSHPEVRDPAPADLERLLLWHRDSMARATEVLGVEPWFEAMAAGIEIATRAESLALKISQGDRLAARAQPRASCRRILASLVWMHGWCDAVSQQGPLKISRATLGAAMIAGLAGAIRDELAATGAVLRAIAEIAPDEDLDD